MTARSGPRRERAAVDPASSRIPRLVLRFVVVTAICFGLASAAIVLVTRHLNTVAAQESVARQADTLANAALVPELRPGDLEGKVVGARRAELDAALRRRLLSDSVLAAAVAGPNGMVTYATDRSLVGKRLPHADLSRKALEGTISSEVTTMPTVAGEQAKALGVYVPITIEGERVGSALIVEDYGPVEDLVGNARFAVTAILEVALLLLFAVLIPILHRATRQLRGQVRQIEWQAYTDPLTELPNRVRFSDSLDQRCGRDGAFAVLIADLDGFRAINDTLGHERGDELLVEVAGRLRAELEPGITVARLGSDEFGFLADGEAAQALALAGVLSRTLEEPIVLGDVPITLELSTGIALAPAHGRDPAGLLRRAEVAMAHAKETRVGTAVYDPERDARDPAELALIGELRSAIESEQLVLHFQPQVEIATGTITCLEALVRWQHPTRGLLPPGAFVPLAEKTALVRLLTVEVLRQALLQCGAWRAAGYDVRVAVNVTMPDLLQPDFPRELVRMMVRAGVDPEALELEITETTLMTDPDRARATLQRLAKMGVRLAVDDFGTGYSSFERVIDLPVHALKIDRSFVQRMERSHADRTMVRCVLDLARNLGLTTVAEGVETEETFQQLRALGCDDAQGFLIQRPAPADELEALLAERARCTPALRAHWVELPAVGR